MLRIYSVPEAQDTILRRRAVFEVDLPPTVAEDLARSFGEGATPESAVASILSDVRARGDAALRDWTERFDAVRLENFLVPPASLDAALNQLPAVERAALDLAVDRVRRFHQCQPAASWTTQDLGGKVGQWIRPIRRVGLYIPAGSAPLPSTVIMSAVPAQVAGVKEIAIVTPPARATGQVAPVILAAAAMLGIREVYALGGAQAIAALAFGTPSIPRVDKIFGPGNLFVTLAKRQVFGLVGIDSLAGPTETIVIADETARPAWVAADLLAQAEHDRLASAILLTPSRSLAEQVGVEVGRMLERLSRSDIAAASLTAQGGAVITRDLSEALALSNAYGPEHLCLSVADPWHWAEQVTSAGGIFIGEGSCEVLGDYTAGPSHVMPTSGSARFSSQLNLWDFVRVVGLVALDPDTAAQAARAAAVIARAEGLDAHAQAADLRAGMSGEGAPR